MNSRLQEPRRRSVVVAIAAIVLLTILAAIVVPGVVRKSQPATNVPATQKTVVIGVGGIQWGFVNEETAPNLAKFAQRAALADHVVNAVDVTACPGEGWLTLNTGRNTLDLAAGGPCLPLAEPVDGKLASWSDWQEINKANPYKPALGALGDRLADGDVSVASIGPGAATAVADKSGRPVGTHVDLAPGVDGASAVAAYKQVADRDLVVVDLGSLAFEDADADKATEWSAAFTKPAEPTPEFLAEVTRLDRELGALLDAIDPDTTVLFLSLSDADQAVARLQSLAIAGPGIEPGIANSRATRLPGIVQLTDVYATVVHLAGLEPSPAQAGSPLRVATVPSGSSVEASSADDALLRIERLADSDLRAATVRFSVGPTYIGIGVLLGLYGLAALAWVLGARRLQGFLRLAGPFVAALPISTMLANLFPWWRADQPLLTLGLAVLGFAFLIWAAGQFLSRWSRVAPTAVVAVVIVAVISIDAMLGSPIQSSSVIGTQPQTGGRFYGISNVPWTMMSISAIYLATLAAWFLREERARVRVAVVLAIGAAVTVVDGSPSVGADFGGPPALIVAFLLLATLLLGRGLTRGRLVGLFAVAGLLTLAISFFDWLRPADSRSHLGRFFQSILDGEAIAIVIRKADAALPFFPWWVWAIVALVGIGAIVAWRRVRPALPDVEGLSPERRSALLGRLRENTSALGYGTLPEFRYGAIAAAALVVVGVLVNDSGLAILAMGAMTGVPLWLSGILSINRGWGAWVSVPGPSQAD